MVINMSFHIWLIIDICVVMLVVTIINIFLFDVSPLFLTIPLIILGTIAAVGITRKLRSRK